MLIGIAGRARAGKDTAKELIIDIMRDKRGEVYHGYEFARPIKEACRVIFGWNDEHLYGSLKESIDSLYNVSPRYAMQTLGTEWGRDTINKSIWANRAKRELENANGNLIISDVRFENEVNFIHDNGGVIIEVISVGQTQHEVIEGSNSHESEGGVSHLLTENDLIVFNDKPQGFQELKNQLETHLFKEEV